MSSSTATPTPSQNVVSGDADNIRVTFDLTVPRSQDASLLIRSKNLYVADALATRGGDQTETQATLAASNFWENNFGNNVSEAVASNLQQIINDSGFYRNYNVSCVNVRGEYQNIIQNLVRMAERNNLTGLAAALQGCTASYNGRVLTIGTESDESRNLLQRSSDLPSFARQLFNSADIRIDIMRDVPTDSNQLRNERSQAAQASGGSSSIGGGSGSGSRTGGSSTQA